MKTNKRNRKVDEGLGDALGGAARALVGDQAVSAIKGAFTGAGTKEQLTQDLFFKDFVNDAVTSLKNAVKSGLVNVKSKTNWNSTEQQPAAPQDNTQTNTQQSPYYGGTSPNIRKSTPAPQPANPFAAPTLKNTNVTTAAKPAAAAPATGGITSGGLGYQPKPAAPAAKQQSDIKAAGKAAAAKPGFQRTAADKIAMRAAGLKESEYNRLNAIFESIIEATEEPAQQVETIGQYMLEWFNSYMQGVNWKRYEPQVMKLIQNIENSYRRDGGKAAIKQLAKAAYAISGPAHAKGSQNAQHTQPSVGTQTTQPTGNFFDNLGKAFNNEKEVYAQLDAIKNNAPKLFSKYVSYHMQDKK